MLNEIHRHPFVAAYQRDVVDGVAKQESDNPQIEPFKGPAGGWGSVRSLAEILPREHLPVEGLRKLARQNKPDGFMCVSCAWPKPHKSHPAEFCEEGAKATAWELTKLHTTPEFFQEIASPPCADGAIMIWNSMAA